MTLEFEEGFRFTEFLLGVDEDGEQWMLLTTWTRSGGEESEKKRMYWMNSVWKWRRKGDDTNRRWNDRQGLKEQDVSGR